MEKSAVIISRARTAIEEGRIEDALVILEENKDENSTYFYLKGEVYYHLQKWGDSLNCFRKVLETSPEYNKAKAYTEMIRNILSFYHTDFFNP